jgi:hypothetical protein
MRRLVWVCLFACGSPPPPVVSTPEPAIEAPPAAPEGDEIVRVRAVVSDRAVHVELEMWLGWIPRGAEGVELTVYDAVRFANAPPGFASFMTQDGAEWTGRLPARDGWVRARWDVRLDHHLAGPVLGLDDVPHPTSGGWLLPGRALFPRFIRLFDGRSIEAETELTIEAEGDVIGSPPRRDRVFFAGSIEPIADALYVTGTFRRAEVAVGGARVTLVTSDFDDAALATMADLVTRTLELGARELGPLPPVELFIVHDHIPEGMDGSVTGRRAISVLSATGPTGRARGDDGIVTVHELAHVWNRSDTWWINEGFARWYELRLSLLLDSVSVEGSREALAALIGRYREGADGHTIEASEGPWGYQAGAMIALCAETRLRAAGTTLAAVHRAAREASPQTTDSTLTRDAFLRALGEASPEAREETERLLAHEGPIDLEPCLARAGLRLTREGRVVPRRARGAIDLFTPPP